MEEEDEWVVEERGRYLVRLDDGAYEWELRRRARVRERWKGELRGRVEKAARVAVVVAVGVPDRDRDRDRDREGKMGVTGFFRKLPLKKGWCECLLCGKVVWPPNEMKHMVARHPDRVGGG